MPTPPAEKPRLTREEWSARRAARREQQRANNLLRAAQMHAARLAEAGLPLPQHPLPPVNVGCSGWFYWHWRGGFYPAELPTSGWFHRYAEHFRTVELNAPFYGWPTLAAVRGWVRQVAGREFVYTIKVSELITHVRRFEGTKTLVRDFGYIADLLGDRMGCFLFQLPPSFHFTTASLRRLLSQLEPHRRNVLEFRHASWWNEEVYRALRETGTIFCSCSGPRLPEELVFTGPEIYLRFHGRSAWYRHDYTDAELRVWVARVRTAGAERVWAYFNNDRDGHAVRNALSFRGLLETPG